MKFVTALDCMSGFECNGPSHRNFLQKLGKEVESLMREYHNSQKAAASPQEDSDVEDEPLVGSSELHLFLISLRSNFDCLSCSNLQSVEAHPIFKRPTPYICLQCKIDSLRMSAE